MNIVRCRRNTFVIAALCLLYGALAACRAAAAEPNAAVQADGLIASDEPGWPQWRGPRRDGHSPEKGLLQTWPDGGPKLLWKYEQLGQGWSSPICVGDRLYITGDVGDDLAIFAFDTRDGKLLWRATNGRAWRGPYPGARACCAFSAGRLYHLNAHGRVACLDAATGKELWAVDVLERFAAQNITWGTSECLLVDGPRLIVTPGGEKALAAALDKQSGETRWTTPPLDEGRATYSSPILFRCGGRRVLANCSAAHGFGLDADNGKLLWSVPLKNRYLVNTSTPIYGDGRVFYVTAYFAGGCFQLRPQGETLLAEQAWPTELDTVTGSGVLADGVLYAAGYRKSKWWFALDWRSGETRGELKDATTGAAIYADGRLYCMAEDGRAALLTPVADGFRCVGRMQLTAEKVRDAWAHPVLLDGRLYLRYHDTLWCYGVGAR